MQIGLVGGIGAVATDRYYRRPNAIFAAPGAAMEMMIAYTGR